MKPDVLLKAFPNRYHPDNPDFTRLSRNCDKAFISGGTKILRSVHLLLRSYGTDYEMITVLELEVPAEWIGKIRIRKPTYLTDPESGRMGVHAVSHRHTQFRIDKSYYLES